MTDTDRHQVRTTCTLDCPDTCSLAVTVDNGAVVKVDAADGPDANPWTDGWICQKVRRLPAWFASPRQLAAPLRRRADGGFEEISWDDALDTTADRLRATIDRRGARAVVAYLYNSSAGAGQSNDATAHLLATLGVPEVAHTICAATSAAAWRSVLGSMPSADPLDLEDSDLVVVLGANPSASNTHLTPRLTAARRRGATVVVVDPRRTPTAARADVHLAVRPGTDAALFGAVTRALIDRGRIDLLDAATRADGVDDFVGWCDRWTIDAAADETGVAAADIERFVELVSTSAPAMLRLGWGAERNRNGGAAHRVALGLWLLAGHVGRRGAGVLASTSRFTGPTGGRSDPPWQGEPFNMNRVGRALCDGDVGMLFVQGANPAVTAPDAARFRRGMARDDVFAVVHDPVMTDTARAADLVLPAATFLEGDDVAASYGTHFAGAVRAAVPPRSGRLGNDRLGRELAARLGIELGEPEPLAVASSRSGAVAFLDVVPDAASGNRALVGGIDYLSPTLADGELWLLTPASSRSINSMLADSNRVDRAVHIHPDAAATAGVVDGDVVELSSSTGSWRTVCQLDSGVRRDTAWVAKGAWLVDGGGVNDLVPDDLEPTVGGACFNDAKVTVRAVRDGKVVADVSSTI